MAAITTFASTGASVALAATEVQVIPSSLSISVAVSKALKTQELDKWCCSVSSVIGAQAPIGSQIRIRRNSDEFAAYTVTEIRSGDPSNAVRMNLAGRQRLGTSDTFSATLLPVTSIATLSDSQAKSAGEFTEWLSDSKSNQGLVAIAPHGGAVETRTDLQAQRVGELLAGVSTWSCKGYKPGGGTYDRWHITSTDINPNSFPGLAKIAKRDFAYSVSFHGMSASGILIGGGGPLELKQQLRTAIQAAFGSTSVSISIASKGDKLSGMSSRNVTNWLTAGGSGGIQLEQSHDVRSNHWAKVASAVAQVYSGLV
jgi:phage replication-related protein YjqB (UPF0714/DUF867 family)